VCQKVTCREDQALVRGTRTTDATCELISCPDYEYLANGVCRRRQCKCREQLLINGFCSTCAADEIPRRVLNTGGFERYVCERLTCPVDYRLVRPTGENECTDPFCQLIECREYEYLDNGVCRRRDCECRQQLLINGFCGDCSADETVKRVEMTLSTGVTIDGTTTRRLSWSRNVCERLTCPVDYRLMRATRENGNECSNPYCQLITCGDYEYLDNGVCRRRTCECRQQLLINGFCGDCAADETAKRVTLTSTDGSLNFERYVCERLTCPVDYRLVRPTGLNNNRCEDPFCKLITC